MEKLDNSQPYNFTPLRPEKRSSTQKRTFTEIKQAASEKIHRVGESFKRKAIVVLSPPKSGPGSGLVKRAKTDQFFSTSGTIHSPDKNDQALVEAFHTFNVAPRVPFDKPALTPAQLEKAKELKADKLLEIAKNPKATRQDFDTAAWEQLDKVNFALTQEHLYKLSELFNTPYHEKTSQEFEGNWNEALVAETLAKALAYTENIEGNQIKLPVKKEDGRYDLKAYTIHKRELGDNLPCYVLTAEGEKGWIVPRGTELVKMRQAAMESILADCDPDGIAHKVLERGREKIDAILSLAGPDAIISGHSLGGLLANELTARFPASISQCYGFSAPGISKATFRSITHDEIGKKIINFQTEGDLVPSAGRHYIGKNYAITTEAKDAIHAHLQHNLNRPKTRITLIDNEKESQKLMRKVSETTRKGVGGTILKMTALFSKKAPTWAKP